MPGYQNAFADSIIGRGKGVGVYFKNHAAIEGQLQNQNANIPLGVFINNRKNIVQ